MERAARTERPWASLRRRCKLEKRVHARDSGASHPDLAALAASAHLPSAIVTRKAEPALRGFGRAGQKFGEIERVSTAWTTSEDDRVRIVVRFIVGMMPEWRHKMH